MICCCGCKQLIRKRSGCRLTGRDSRGAGDSWEHVNYLAITLSLACLLLDSTFIRSSATRGLLRRCGGIIVSYLQYPLILSFSLRSLYLLIESEPAFNSPCCASSCRFSHPFSSHLLTSTFFSLAGPLPLTHPCSLNQ